MYTVVQYQTNRNFLYCFITPFDVTLDSTIHHEGREGKVYELDRFKHHTLAGAKLTAVRKRQELLNNQLSAKLFKLGLNHHGS